MPPARSLRRPEGNGGAGIKTIVDEHQTSNARAMTKLNRIISETLQISEDQITPELTIHDMPTWNSLSHIELIVSIEGAFEIELSADDIVAMTSVERIQRVLRDRGASWE